MGWSVWEITAIITGVTNLVYFIYKENFTASILFFLIILGVFILKELREITGELKKLVNKDKGVG